MRPGDDLRGTRVARVRSGARASLTWLVVVSTAAACATPGVHVARHDDAALSAGLASGARAALSPTRREWLPGDTATGLSITINIPAYRLDVRDSDSSWSYRVAVGTPRYATPRGSFRVREIVWNPWWVPPPSDWARDERLTPPGPDNPMGRVKMRFADLVFVHGTPLERSLGSAASHACVRLANADAIALARLVHRRATPEVPEAVLDSALADSTRTRRFAVARVVLVTVRYDLAEVVRDTLWVHPDVYRLGRAARAEALRALAVAGVDTTRVSAATLGEVLRAGRRRAAVAPLADLVPAPPPAARTP
jgi:hypothetical protein